MANHTGYGTTRYKANVLELLESQRDELWKLRYLADDIVSLLREIATILREEPTGTGEQWEYKLLLPAEQKGGPECVFPENTAKANHSPS